ncbi:hypothetical protein [Alkalibacillus salilacus]|uniref:Uncharacterized protein n=1 Tax=Alkalibacillus salilacus TaxID=284582 RepID=A0ABT9VD94_9BACI|nr:hypothetical protein [Alkalibacillus salilacus]MDQ0158790.1 hypothetical protein [Alkalibacillus salilacus]
MKKRFSLTLIFTLLFSMISFSTINGDTVEPKTIDGPDGYIEIPSSVDGAVVQHEQIFDHYSQEITTYYMNEDDAEDFARELRNSSWSQVGSYVSSALLGHPNGTILGGGFLIDSLRRNSIAEEIEDYADGGVKFEIVDHRYGWGLGSVENWSTDWINIGENSYTELIDYDYYY